MRRRRRGLDGERRRSWTRLVTATLAATGLPPLHGVAASCAGCRTSTRSTSSATRDHLAGLDAWADALPRVTTFGRLGLFAHDNTHHALAMAYDAVAALRPDGSLDAAAWSAARSRFARHVVED